MKKPAFPKSDFYYIKDLASFLHVTTHTIRNLETEFAIEVKKDLNGKRVYTIEDVEKYRIILEKKNESKNLDTLKKSSNLLVEPIKPNVTNQTYSNVPVNYSNTDNHTLTSTFSFENIFSSISGAFKFKFASTYSFILMFALSLASFGSLYLDGYLDIDTSLLGKSDKSMSNVLQATNTVWDYRFDVNVPAYFNSTLYSSEASIDLIRVGDRVLISPQGISAPNIVNQISTVAGDEVLLVDNTDPNNPIISVIDNPTFNQASIGTLNGVTAMDDQTIQTIQDNLQVGDAQTLNGLTDTDFLRSNANTVFSNGIMTFDVSSTLKFNNLSPNTFLKVSNDNTLQGFSINAGLNVSFESSANSLTINVATGAASNTFTSVAISNLFLGGTGFDLGNLILTSASEINKLHTLSGSIITSTSLLSIYPNLDTDASNDIISSNLASSILSAFPDIDTVSSNKVLISTLASLMLSNYPNLDTNALDDITGSNLANSIFNLFPNIDTNAADDSNVLVDAVLVNSTAGKNVYSTNTWYGNQTFSYISSSTYDVATNGKIVLNPGAVPGNTNNSLYNNSDRLYFEDLPLVQVSDHLITSNVNRISYFVTDANGRLLLQGIDNVALSQIVQGSASQLLGMNGGQLSYLTVNGDLTVSTTSASTITFNLNSVNSNTGTFGNANYIPRITVNSKGLITSVSTVAVDVVATNPNNYTTSISFSTPDLGSRTLILGRDGLSNLTASFSLSASDITAALGFVPQTNLGYTPLNSNAFNSANITNALGYVPFGPSNFVAGTNVTLSTTATSVTISAVAGGTNANNFVNNISFSDSTASTKVLTLDRTGLSSLTAIFSISASDVTTALGFIPFNSSNFTATQIINTLGFTPFNSASFNSASITNALGYVPFGPSNFIAGTNVTLSSTATSVTINSSYVDTTNANNFVTGISFTDSSSTTKTLNLDRDGLASLTAAFSISAANVTSALGYIPLKNTTDTLTGNLGISGMMSSANAYVTNQIYGPTTMRILSGIGSVGAPGFAFNGYSTTGFYYVTDTSLRVAISGVNIASFRSSGLQVNGNLSASSANITGSISAPTGLFGSLSLANALPVIFGGTGMASVPNNGQILIGNGSGYTLTTLTAGTNVSISTGAGSITISSTDTNNYVTGISFADSNATSKVLTLDRNGLASLTAAFSISAANVTSALGYTPVNKAGDTIASSLTVLNSISAATIFQNGSRVCDTSGNCAGLNGGILGNGSLGYLSYFAATNSIANSYLYQNTNGIGLFTTNPQEALDIYGALRLSQDMGTAARGNALYQDNGVLYWNGQAVGVVGSTAPGGISGTKDYIPYFNTKDTLIASQLYYESGSAERSLELVANTVINTYIAVGHKNQYSLKLGVAADSAGFFTNFATEDDVVLVNTSNSSTSDLMFALNNAAGKIFFLFGSGVNEKAPFAMTFNNGNTTGNFGINTTAPSTQLDVVGSAKVSGTLAAKFFSNPSTNSFEFLSGGNFRGNISAANGTFTNLSLANALPVIFGGTGMASVPNNGQILIGNGSGYTLTTLTAGTNVSISTGAGSITISSTDTNNYVTGISFADSNATSKVLTLDRNGLASLTAAFSISAANVTSALGYTPLNSTAFNAANITGALGFIPFDSVNFTATQIINTLGYTPLNSTAFNSANITGALGYIPFNSTNFTATQIINTLGYTPLNSTALNAANITGALGFIPFDSVNFTAIQIINTLGYTPLNSTAFNAASITNALGYVPFGPTNFVAGTNVTLSSTATSVTINSSYVDTNNYVTGISFADSNATSKVLTLDRNGLASLTAAFSISAANVTSALGYTPLKNTSDTLAGNLRVTQTLSAGTLITNSLIITNNLGQEAGLFTYDGALQIKNTYTKAIELYSQDQQGVDFYAYPDLSLNSPIKFAKIVSGATSYIAGDFSAANGSFTNLSLANALPVIFGGTGMASVPNRGQILIGNGTGYTLSTLTAGTNVSISTGAGSITISSSYVDTDTNNYTTDVLFSTPAAGTRDIRIARLGLATLSASFTLNSSDITTALGYTPLKNTTDSLIGNLGISGSLSAASVTTNHLFVNDYSNTAFNMKIESSVNGVNRNLRLDIGAPSLTNTTLGLNLQSVYFTTPSNATVKNLVFNHISADNNLTVDLFKGGTMPAIIAGKLDTFGNDLSAAIGYFDSVRVNGYFSAGSSTLGRTNIVGLFSAGNSTLGTTTINGNISAAFGFFNTVATSTFSNPLSGVFTFLTGANFNGNISAANGTFITLSAQTLNVNNLFTVDASGSVFNNGVTFNDSVEFNAVGDLAVANDLVFTNNSFSKLRTATDLSIEVGEPFNSSNLNLVTYNNGVINLTGRSINILGTFSAGNSTLANAFISGNAIFSSSSTIGAAFFSSPLSSRIFDFTTGTIAASTFSSPNNFNFQGGQVIIGTDQTASQFSIPSAAQWLMISNKGRAGFNANTGWAGVAMHDSLAAANTRNWLTFNFGGTYNIQALNDAWNVGTNAIQISRGLNGTAPTITAINLNADRVLFTSTSTIGAAFFSSPLANNTFTFNGNLSAALGSFTNLGVTSNLSAATATFRGTVTVSNPSGGTQLNLVSNGGVGNNIELGFYDGATKRANFSMDSTNTFEFEGASGTNVHFNVTSGAYRYWVNGVNKFAVENDGNVYVGRGSASTDSNFNTYIPFDQAFSITNYGKTRGLLFNMQQSNAAANLRNYGIGVVSDNIIRFMMLDDTYQAAYSYLESQRSTLAGGTPVSITTSLNAYNSISLSVRGQTALSADNEGVIIDSATYDPIRIGYANVGMGAINRYSVSPGLGYLDIVSNFGAAGYGIRLGVGSNIGGWQTVLLIESDAALNIAGVNSQNVIDDRTLCTSSTNLRLEIKNGACGTSSIRFKENITTLPYGLAEIMQLNPVEYNYKNYNSANAGGRTKERIGFIAEEMNEIIPEVVLKEDGIVDSIEYKDLIPLAIKGIQEQQVQITSLSNAVAGMNLASMQSIYEQFTTTLENLSMSTENGALVVNTNLTVTGEALFNNASFTGDVTIGQMKFDSLNNDLSINGASCVNIDGTLNTALCDTQSMYLMKNKAGNLNIFDGKVVINPNGEMIIEKIQVGEVAAAKVKASEYEVVAGSEVSGNSNILTGQTEITILTSKVKSNSKIFVTANNNLEGKSIYVSNKVEGVSFTVKLNGSVSSDVNFDWFILNIE